MKKGRGLFSHVAVLGFCTALSKITVFFMLPLYTAHLTPAAFGTVDILVNTAVLLLPFVSLCAPEAVFRFAAGGSDEAAVLEVGKKLLRRGLLLLLTILPLLAFFRIFRPYLLYLFCYVTASVWHSYYGHILRARGQYGLYAVQQLFCTLCMVGLAFLFLAVLGLAERGYLMAIFLADAITALILYYYVHTTKENTAKSTETGLFRAMLRYAIPLIPAATLWWILAVSDHYILLGFHGEAVTGIYAAAGKLPSLLTFATSVFLEAWHFAAIREREERRDMLFEKIYGALLPVLCLFVLLLIFCARPLAERLFSAEYGEAALYVPFLAIAALFSALSSFLGSVYVVKLRSGASLLTALVGAVVNIALDLWWIPARGAIGAVAATFCSYTVVFLWRSVHCSRVMPFRQHFGKLTVATLALFACAILTVTGRLVLAIGSGVCAILPFWHEIDDSVRILFIYGKKIFQKSTKKEKRY